MKVEPPLKKEAADSFGYRFLNYSDRNGIIEKLLSDEIYKIIVCLEKYFVQMFTHYFEILFFN